MYIVTTWYVMNEIMKIMKHVPAYFSLGLQQLKCKALSYVIIGFGVWG
jgi:hypothetical protein